MAQIAEQLAVAVLKSGGSFQEAAEVSKMSVGKVMKLWEQKEREEKVGTGGAPKTH